MRDAGNPLPYHGEPLGSSQAMVVFPSFLRFLCEAVRVKVHLGPLSGFW
jgi:hypothetical protein